MIGIWLRILLLAGGGLGGYWLASPRAAEDTPSPAVQLQSTVVDAVSADEPKKFEVETAKACPPADQDEQETPDEQGARRPDLSELPETGLPPTYLGMMKPRPRAYSMADRYSAFVHEGRNAAWAEAIEARLYEAIASSGLQGIQAEYVRCGTRHCVIAGYVDPSVEHNGCEVMGAIGRADIFHDSYGSSCASTQVGGLGRFVSFIDSELEQ